MFIGFVIDNYFIYDIFESFCRLGKFYFVLLIGGFNSDEGVYNIFKVYYFFIEIMFFVFRDFIKLFVKN